MNRVAIVFLIALASHAIGQDWPQFRGPRGDGISTATNLPVSWGGVFDRPAWSCVLPGAGWSSPIVVDGRIWLTASEATALPENLQTEKLDNHKHGEEGFRVDASVNLFALEVDATTGTLLRRIDLIQIEKPEPIHSLNTYASPTSVSDGERLFCHFGSLGTLAVELKTGQILWRRTYRVDDITGPGVSPVLCDGKLILVRDGADKQFVVALDALSGEETWRTERPAIEAVDSRHRRAFCTPLVIDSPGGRQIVTVAANWVVAYEPESGNEIWRASYAKGHAIVPRPVYSDGVVYVCSGYQKPVLGAIRVDGTSDVSETHVNWVYRKQVPVISSPIVYGDEIYFASESGVVTCLDRVSGDVIWIERIGGRHAVSPTLADGKLYFTSAEGVTTVIRPGRTFEQLAKNQLFGRTMASFAVAGNSILIRNSTGLHCVKKGSL